MRFSHVQAATAPATPGGSAPSGYVVERPPPGLARGKYPTSPLWIGALGATLLLVTLLYYFFKMRKPRS